MRTVTCALAVMVVSAWVAGAQDVTGEWQGTVVLDGQPTRFVYEIRRDQAGNLAVNVLNPAGALVPAESVTLDGPNLKIVDLGVFVGRISPAGDAIAGVLTEGDRSAPFVLHRLGLGAVQRERPKQQYRFKDVSIPIPTGEEPRIAKFSPQPALDYLDQGAIAWAGQQQCVSCHTTGTYMLIRPQLVAAFGPPRNDVRDSFLVTLKRQMATAAGKLQNGIDTAMAVQVAAGLAQWDAQVRHHLSPETADALALMFRLQLADGSWKSLDDAPPFQSSAYQLATVAARAVGVAPGWLDKQQGTPLEGGVRRLVHYLRTGTPSQADYDRAALLWAATEMPELLDEGRRQELVKMLFGHQEADGGWSLRSMARPEEWARGDRAKRIAAQPEFANHTSDGHMTGMAIVVLRKAGVPTSDPRIQRGVAWLLTNQRASGRWWTRSLNTDNLHYINYSGTAYPLLALQLCGRLPQRAGTAQN